MNKIKLNWEWNGIIDIRERFPLPVLRLRGRIYLTNSIWNSFETVNVGRVITAPVHNVMNEWPAMRHFSTHSHFGGTFVLLVRSLVLHQSCDRQSVDSLLERHVTWKTYDSFSSLLPHIWTCAPHAPAHIMLEYFGGSLSRSTRMDQSAVDRSSRRFEISNRVEIEKLIFSWENFECKNWKGDRVKRDYATMKMISLRIGLLLSITWCCCSGNLRRNGTDFSLVVHPSSSSLRSIVIKWSRWRSYNDLRAMSSTEN